MREILDCADQWRSQSTSGCQDRINVNCIDYMGRNALHLAVDSENLECIELLLDRLSWECQEEVSAPVAAETISRVKLGTPLSTGRVHGSCRRPAHTSVILDACVHGLWARVSFFDTRAHGPCWQKALNTGARYTLSVPRVVGAVSQCVPSLTVDLYSALP